MPTEPFQKIIWREMSIAQARPSIEVASPLLVELVNHASNALVRCQTAAPPKGNVDVAPFALYKHIIEMTDGVQVLMSQSCSWASVPLVRTSFEALMSMEYIFESAENYALRSMSWLAQHLRNKL